MKNVKTAVIGCGAISDIYLTNMLETFSGLDVAACCASHLEHAQEKAEKYGIRAASTQEILQDPDIGLPGEVFSVLRGYEAAGRSFLCTTGI